MYVEVSIWEMLFFMTFLGLLFLGVDLNTS